MGGDKTEEPTEHKLREARKKGQIATSQDVIAASIFLIGFFMIYFNGAHISGKLQEFINLCIAAVLEGRSGPGVIMKLCEVGLDTMLVVVMPVAAVCFVVAFFFRAFIAAKLYGPDVGRLALVVLGADIFL